MNKTKLTTLLLACLCISTVSFAGCDFLGESSSGSSSSSIPSSETETSESAETTISSSEAETSENTESIPSVEEQRETLKTTFKNSFDIKNYTATIENTYTPLRNGKLWWTEFPYKEAVTLKFDGNKTYAHNIYTDTIDDEHSSESFEYLIWQATSVQRYTRYSTWNENEWRIDEYDKTNEEYNDVVYMRVIEYDDMLDAIIHNLSYDSKTGLYIGNNILLENYVDEEEGYSLEWYALNVSIQIKDGNWHYASWTIQGNCNFYDGDTEEVTLTGSATFTDYGATVVELPEDLIKR